MLPFAAHQFRQTFQSDATAHRVFGAKLASLRRN
jgi:hypothetical protein